MPPPPPQNNDPLSYFGAVAFSIDDAFERRIRERFERAFNLPDPKVAAAQRPKSPPVTWDDVCGQAKAKAALREAIELPIRHADIYRRYGRKPTKGVLLSGPPGNGKTMLAKAAATAVAQLYGKSPDASENTSPRSFISVKGPELLDKYIGETEVKIRRLFEEAREHKRRHGYPSIIFLDEAEAIVPSRGGKSAWLATTMVPQFLTEMDGLVESSAIVLLATNRPDDIDPAILRDGRVDRKIHVGRPERDDASAVLTQALRPRPIASGESVDELVARACEGIFAAGTGLFRLHLTEGPPKTMLLHHAISYALLVGIVERATSRAIEREISGGAGGISAADLEAEVANTIDETRSTIPADALDDFCAGFREKVREVERIRPVRREDAA